MSYLRRMALLAMLAVLAIGLAFGGAVTSLAQDATETPVTEPTAEPTIEPTTEPTIEPTDEPTVAAPAEATTAPAVDTATETPPTTEIGRPVHIHSGSCAALGDVVQPLTNLVNAEGGVTEEDDLDAATDDEVATVEAEDTPGAVTVDPDELVAPDPVLAEYSFTSVPMPLTDILADEHSINVHESMDAIDEYIACGDIGGTPDANGSVVIGLREQNDSGFSGIAVLTAGADGASTDISVFIAKVADDAEDEDDLELEESDDDDSVDAGAAEEVADPTATP